MVFRPLDHPQQHKIKSRNDLESELFGASDEFTAGLRIRHNEGEAAEHGVYFDDTEYDYMQHIKDLNAGNGNEESYFVEASSKRNAKGKNKMSLEDALRESSLQDGRSESGASTAESLLDEDAFSSTGLKKSTYQDQQEVPDVLAGFQPDMDPRLREVLEALEDDAYVDDEENIFGEIAKDRREVSLEEFEESFFEGDEEGGEEDDGWESDVTEKPRHEYKGDPSLPPPQLSESDLSMLNAPLSDVPDVPMGDGDAPDHGDSDWMKEFSKFKLAQKADKAKPKASPKVADMQSSITTGTPSMASGRKKKRKGAMTSSTGYSMTSSALARTEGLTLLDQRFDKIEEEYGEDDDLKMEMPDDDTASVMTKSSTASRSSVASSQAPSLVRADFDNIMDDFLGGYQIKGKRVKKGGYQTGLEQLDEVRKGLGPARVKPLKAK